MVLRGETSVEGVVYDGEVGVRPFANELRVVGCVPCIVDVKRQRWGHRSEYAQGLAVPCFQGTMILGFIKKLQAYDIVLRLQVPCKNLQDVRSSRHVFRFVEAHRARLPAV